MDLDAVLPVLVRLRDVLLVVVVIVEIPDDVLESVPE